jgi:hypothetical protein
MTVPALTNVATLIEKRRDTLTALLPDRSQQDRFMAALLTYVGPERSLHAPALQESLVIALYQVAKLGLDPGVDCYLIPRSGRVLVVICAIGLAECGAVALEIRGAGGSSCGCGCGDGCRTEISVPCTFRCGSAGVCG